MLWHLEERTVAPVAEPIEHATVEQRGRRGGAVLQTLGRRVHCEHYVQVAHYLTSEPV